jgi:hypothetical protein
MGHDRCLKAINLEETDRIPHWEFISNPDFERFVTGIDPYKHPQKSTLKLLEKLDLDLCGIPIPLTDDPAELGTTHFAENESSKIDESGHRVVRWGSGTTWRWDWGGGFHTLEQVLEFDPAELKYDDGSAFLPCDELFLSVEELAEKYNKWYHQRQDLVDKRSLIMGNYYKTLYMWFLLTFGWNLFMKLVLQEPQEFQKMVDKFALVSQKVFEAWALTDIKLMYSHDDICIARGPVFSPDWYRRHIFPWYKKLWEPLKKAGIKVLFCSDGNTDQVYDDIFKAGADGIFAEHYTNLDRLVEKYGDSKFFLGGIDGRVLVLKGKKEVRAEVERVTKLAKGCPGYFYCDSSHITYNVPIENAVEYFKACKELGKRR